MCVDRDQEKSLSSLHRQLSSTHALKNQENVRVLEYFLNERDVSLCLSLPVIFTVELVVREIGIESKVDR